MTVVLEGGRVGEELGSMALIELGSALAAVTATRDDGSGGSRRDGFTPAWTDHAVPPATPGSTHPASVLRDVPFPSLESARAAVRRCALTRVALLPVAVGSPAEVAAALGPARAARCAAQVLAPGRKGLPRVALERVGAELWDAGVGRDVAADPAWLHALARERRPSAERDPARDEPDDPSSTTETMVYLHPEGILGTVLAWGLDARAALRAVEAPNAMPPEQAVLSANAAHISPGDVAMDPCVGGGAALLASLRLGAARTYGTDVDQDALRTAREALRRCDRDEGDGFSKRAVLARASLVDEALDGEEKHAEERNAEGNDDADLDRVDSNDLIGSLGDSRDSGNDLVGSRVDAILTDLPYGVRSAAIGVGSGPDGAVTPGEMLDALLRLARRRLRPTRGRVAAWVQRWDGDGGMSPEEVKTRANEGGFEVERFAAESRKSGVRRALYVLVPRGSGSRRRDPDPSGFLHAGSVLKASAAFGRAEDIERRAALVAHARLRRGENHGRVASSGGADPWRAAWVGDAPTLRRLFGDDPRVASLVAGVAEPAGARNTPLLAAAGFGRTTIVDMVLRARPETTSAELDAALLRAVEFGRAETAETLIQRGADFRAKRPATRGGGEATHAAAERGHVAVLDVLARAAMTSREDAEVRAAMTSKDVEGRDAAGAAARRGHADAIRAIFRHAPPTAEEATSIAATAARWGHVDALRAVVRCAGRGTAPATHPKTREEATRWSRADVLRAIREWEEEMGSNANATSSEKFSRNPLANATSEKCPVLGARTLFRDARTGAGLFYAPRFWDPDEGHAALRAQVAGDYLPRDDPLVTPADRRGERRPVPRDQAYYAATYVAKDDATEPGATVGSTRVPSRSSDAEPASTSITNRWWASYRYNPDHTRQPAPRSPPDIIRRVAAAVRAACGQTCNHAVVNRYRDEDDAIGAHADKTLDLEDDSYVVSVSFGAARTMTFQPRRAVTENRAGPEAAKRASRALAATLALDDEWRAAVAEKNAAEPRSDERRAATARERTRAATLRETNDDVAAAAAAAREARRAWIRERENAAFETTLEPGSALFFNMAFNDAWTHAIRPAGGDRDGDVPFPSGDGDGDTDEDEGDGGNGGDEVSERSMDGDERAGERVGVTLRRCRTVFDPARQATAEGKPRAWRRAIWRPLDDMADADAAEAPWRGEH